PPAAAPKKVDIAPRVPVPAPVAPAPDPAAVYLHQSAAQQHVAVAPPQAFHGPLHQDPGAPRGFSCKECNRWFETHQGLGGHAAGHKNRGIAAAAAAAIAAGVDP
uniref:C2H2-type domain-containing protein n=1 Tax=Triticum urartu TaxID=4572 RepID=A0A8R7PYJ4_TRIUA